MENPLAKTVFHFVGVPDPQIQVWEDSQLLLLVVPQFGIAINFGANVILLHSLSRAEKKTWFYFIYLG